MQADEGDTGLGIAGVEDVTETGGTESVIEYSVRDSASGRRAVIKVLRAPLETEALARFQRDQGALASLGSHPNLVTVLGNGVTEDGRAYVAYEESETSSLADRVARGEKANPADVLRSAVRISGALESVHRAGIVHGDLGPDDIKLTALGDPQITDAGLAQAAGVDVTARSDLNLLAFVAPELLDGAPADAGSDVYAMGATIFALVSGSLPFVGDDGALVRVIKRISVDPVPDLRPQGVPDALAGVIEKAMAKAPADRYASAQELGRACQQAEVAQGLPVTEMTVFSEAGQSAAAPTAPPADATTSMPVPPPPGAAGAAVAAGAAGAAVAATGGPPGGPPPGGAAGGPPGGPPGGGPDDKKASKAPVLIIAAVAVVALLVGIVAFVVVRNNNDDNAEPPVTVITTTTTEAKTTTTTEATTTTTAATATVVATENQGNISAEVPTIWVVQGIPITNADGTTTPDLSAAPDLAAFLDPVSVFSSSGIEIVALDAATIDLTVGADALLDKVLQNPDSRSGTVLATACTSVGRADVFSKSGLKGRGEVLNSCNGGTATIGLAVLIPPDGSFIVVVEGSALSQFDQDAIDHAVDTLTVTAFP